MTIVNTSIVLLQCLLRVHLFIKCKRLLTSEYGTGVQEVDSIIGENVHNARCQRGQIFRSMTRLNKRIVY